mmetsp:Transcript_4857/g.5609  ORF Transcript_4857/g.5609 Transcript_4857/m.5609 type:complete len:429 (+) Transcript_4857:235-1521(+)
MADITMEDGESVKEQQFEAIESVMETDPQTAIGRFKEMLKGRAIDQPLDIWQERAAFRLMKLYAHVGDSGALISLLQDLRRSFDVFSKSKRESYVKTIFDKLQLIPGTEEEQITICEEYIEYFKEDKRSFLRQRFETKLAALLSKKGEYPRALQLLSSLQSELKKLDDKLLLVELFLIESRTHHALNNLAKAKSTLTAARSNANAIYVGVQLQAEIDMQSGTLNAEEKDFRTSFSYFLEAHEGFMSKDDSTNGLQCLKYMLLSKIMNGQGDEVHAILNAKNSIQFVDDEAIVMLKEVAKAYKDLSLAKFTLILEKSQDIVNADLLLKTHLSDLRNELLEQNLVRIIEPYSRVEIDRVAELINLPAEQVLSKLSQMILDKKFRGILDQGTMELIVFEDPIADSTYEDSLTAIQNMGHVVNNLVRRAKVG